MHREKKTSSSQLHTGSSVLLSFLSSSLLLFALLSMLIYLVHPFCLLRRTLAVLISRAHRLSSRLLSSCLFSLSLVFYVRPSVCCCLPSVSLLTSDPSLFLSLPVSDM